MRTFVYCRVSTREQGADDHYSLGNQEQRCRDYIKLKQWRCSLLRKDIASGKSSDRAGFQDLLQAVQNSEVDVVVVYRLDRLSRNVRDIYDFLDQIRELKIAFVSVTEGFDTTTAMGRAMLGVAAVFAQLTREMISENVKDGLLRRKEAGFVTGSLTNTYGYDYSKADGNIIVNPAEAAVVREIFDWYTENNWGHTKIASVLNMRGLRGKTGGNWAPRTIKWILLNPVIAGRVALNGGTIEGRHEAIVSAEKFAAAQALFQSRTSIPNRSQQSNYLLSGTLRCGSCGIRLMGHMGVNSKTKTHYLSYIHPRVAKTLDRACPSIARRVPIIDGLVVDQIRELASNGTVEKIILRDVQSRRIKNHIPKIKERDKILIELNGMGEKFMQWAERLDAGKIDEEQFERQNGRLLAKKKTIQERLDEINQEVGDEESLEVSLAEVKQTLSDFPQVWDSLEHEERREVLRLLIESLTIYRDRLELKLLFLDPIIIPLKVKERTVMQ